MPWRGWPGNERGASVFLINGQNDTTTPEWSVDAMTISGAASPIEGHGWDPDPFRVWDTEPSPLPIAGNAVSLDGDPLTIATWLDSTTGHFTIYDVEEAREMAIDFLLSATGGTPTLDLR